ncbi:MAG: Ni/Fe hydrogenase subunit alpha [Planctomycetota bacterium]|nr:MAG: Ni/Fe hydrogenase subunit alpha [Planctomycetota bacterium]
MTAPAKKSKKEKPPRRIKVDYLARVEGEGGLRVKIRNEKVQDVKLDIFEPPRFFEAFMHERRFTEAPDITARICGICPVAYQMSSCHAMEDACGVKLDGPIRELRRLLYCGEWIESHVLHVYMLHAPDFLGYESAIHLAADHPDPVKRGLALKKIGNDIVNIVGGREIHPINVRLGGFYRAPTKKELSVLVPRLEMARDMTIDTIRWVATLDFPDLEPDYEFVALRHPDEYPFNEGRLVSSKGLDFPIEEFYDHIEEVHVEHSNALHSRVKERGAYFVGPQARYSLNYDQLTPLCKEMAEEIGLGKVCRNPFKSIVVRSIETLYAVEEALRIIGSYEYPDKPYVEVEPKAGFGHGCTEAPRGILYHRYQIDEQGLIRDARIVPPTAQNQMRVEEDLVEFIQKNLELPQEDLTWKCEQAIRNYDPCISCATHFLKLDLERE